MGLYRSEKMKLYQLTLPKDEAYTALLELGDLGSVQLIDLNVDASAFNLPYTKDLKAIELAERKLTYLLNESKKYFLPLNKPVTIDGFQNQLRTIGINKRKSMTLLLEEIEKDI